MSGKLPFIKNVSIVRTLVLINLRTKVRTIDTMFVERTRSKIADATIAELIAVQGHVPLD